MNLNVQIIEEEKKGDEFSFRNELLASHSLRS